LTKKLQITYRPLEKLIPYANNSRTHSDAQVAQIAASIKEFGFTNPVLVDEEGGVIAGHGRILAARTLGMGQVPCITLAGLTKAQRRAYVIADNKLALNAGWDNELLSLELDDLAGLGFDVGLTGFTQDEIDALRPQVLEPGLTDDDAVPEVQAEPVSKPGDVWILGKHRVMCGDSTILDAVETLMAGQKADMVFTDPPYNVDYDPESRASSFSADRLGKGRLGKIKNDKKTPEAFRAFLDDVYGCVDAVLNAGRAIYICHADLEGHHFRAAFIAQPWKLQSCVIWKKSVLTYVDVIVRRWQEFTGKQATLEASGATFDEVVANSGAALEPAAA